MQDGTGVGRESRQCRVVQVRGEKVDGALWYSCGVEKVDSAGWYRCGVKK